MSEDILKDQRINVALKKLNKYRRRKGNPPNEIADKEHQPLDNGNGTPFHNLKGDGQLGDELTRTIEILTSEKIENQNTILDLRNSLRNVEVERNELMVNCAVKEKSLSSCEIENQSLKSELEEVKIQIEELRNDSSRHTKSSNELINSHEELKDENNELKEKLRVLHAENAKLLSDVETLKRQNEFSQVLLNQMNNSVSEDKGEQKLCENTEISHLQSEISALKDDYKKLLTEKERLESDHIALTDQFAALSVSENPQVQEPNEVENNSEQRGKEENELQSKVNELHCEINHMKEIISDISNQKQQLEECYNSRMVENENLSKLVGIMKLRVTELESEAERNKVKGSDSRHLLNSLESEKVAAARAISQNNQLKDTVEQLQNGLMMMSNKKLELTEKLEMELHERRKLQTQISTLTEKLNSSTRSDSPDTLTPDNECNIHSETRENEVSIPAAVDEVTQGPAESLPTPEAIPESHNNEESASTIEDISLTTAFEALQTRFLNAMKEVASLTDQKQNLEHTVQKLQLETDIVGDYITIYQFQRGVMKQQMQDLQFELELMKTERQEKNHKIETLQDLLQRINVKNADSKILNFHPSEKSVLGLPQERNENRKTSNSSESPDSSYAMKQAMLVVEELQNECQVDSTVIQNLNSCQHCSGKLITL